MNGKVFLDTNILLYAHDRDAGDKYEIANAIVKEHWENKTGVISNQVLQEFYINVTRKINPPLSPAQAREILRIYSCWQMGEISANEIIRASEIEENNRISFWDALIIVAALEAKVEKILTEDLNPGQKIEGINIENPFT